MNMIRISAAFSILLGSISPRAQSENGNAPTATTAPATQPNNLGIIVGYDTTRLLGPLRSDGTVDYIAAINATERRGVTPENNAAILLLKIGGTNDNLINSIYRRGAPADAPDQQRDQTLKALGLDRSIEGDGCWHSWKGFGNGEKETDKEMEEDWKRIDDAQCEPWAAQSNPKLNQWVLDNQKALELAALMVKKNRFWMPLVPADGRTLGSCEWRNILIWKQMGEALRMRAMRKMYEGDDLGVEQDLHTAYRLGWLLQQDSDASSLLVAVYMQRSTCRAEWSFLRHRALTTEQLRRIAADLPSYEAIPDIFTVFSRMERYQYTEWAQEMAKQDAELGMKQFGLASAAEVDKKVNPEILKIGLHRADWNRILRMVTRTLDDFVSGPESMTMEDCDIRQKHIEKIWDELHTLRAENNRIVEASPKHDEHAWLWPQPGESSEAYSDRIGVKLLLMPDLNPRNIVRAKRYVTVTRFLYSFELYKADHKSYPDKLDELLPKYLQQLPQSTTKWPITYERIAKGYKFSWTGIQTEQESGDYSKADSIVITINR